MRLATVVYYNGKIFQIMTDKIAVTKKFVKDNPEQFIGLYPADDPEDRRQALIDVNKLNKNLKKLHPVPA